MGSKEKGLFNFVGFWLKFFLLIYLKWEELIEIGKKEDDEALNESLKRIAINQCCCVIYTVGFW